MGRKAFTVSVVVATIAWSIGLAALLMPLAAGAATLSSGDLIKASLPAVYYYGADGKRYVFPNEKTYMTWYSDFSSVKKITDAELAAISIGGNATYKPGAKMVKITTDPKVYAVDAGGTLRWINSETVAAALYGGTWNKMVDDVPDAFFTNYKVGADIAQTSDFVKATVTATAASINVDKGLSNASNSTGALTIATDSATPVSGSLVADATNGGQRRAPVLKVKFTAGAADVKVTTLKLKRGGISKDGDVDQIYLMDGKKVLAEAQSITDGVATVTAAPELFTVAAGTSKVLDVVMDLNKSMSSGATINWSLASADVTSNAATISGSAVGSTMTTAVVTDLGSLKLGTTNTAPASVDPGTTGKEMWRLSFEAQSQDLLLTYVKFNNVGTSYDTDITNVKLMDGATQLDGVNVAIKDKTVEFDLTNMTGGGYKIQSGQSKQLTLVGDIVAGTNRTFWWSIQKQEDVRVKDLEYGVDVFANTGTAATFSVEKPTADTDINVGTLSQGLATDSPNTYIADGGTALTLAKFNFKANGEDVKITNLTIKCLASTTTNDLVNTLIKLDGVQVGTTDATMNCDDGVTEGVYTFSNNFILTAGVNHVVEIVGDLSDSAWAAEDTIRVGFGAVTAGAQGKTSLTSINITAVNGHTLTLKGAAVTAIKDQSFTDRSSTNPTGVTNAQNVKVGAFIIVGGSGEAADISQITLLDNATYPMNQDFQNLVLKDSSGNQIGTTIATLNASQSTYTFTPASAIRIAAGEQKAYNVWADVKGSVTNAATLYAAVSVDAISATGVNTGSSADWGTAGTTGTEVDLQNVYLANHGNLTVEAAADTPVGQQLVLGSTGVSLAKFKLSADAAENITVTEFIVNDDMTSAFGGAGKKAATGTIKNLKLYNGSTLLASVSAFRDVNASSSEAKFSGFTLNVPANQNVVLEVKGDLSSYVDGGKPSSTHRLMVLPNLEEDGAGTVNPVVAVGAGSGITMSLAGLDIGITSGTADVYTYGSYMEAVRAKLTLAHAADSPSGSATPASEQTVAKFVATNSANIGNYSLYIRNLALDVSSVGSSMPVSGSVNMKIYKDSISTANRLATTDYSGGYASGQQFLDTQIPEASFTDLEIAAGSSKTVIVTLDTSTSNFSANDTLSIGIDVAGDVQWDDGNSDSVDYYTCDSLPLAGKTLVY